MSNGDDEGLFSAEHMERTLQFFKILAVLLSIAVTLVPVLVGYWILGEDARAQRRWESIQFESAVTRAQDRYYDRLRSRIDRLSRKMEDRDTDLRKEMQELKSSVDRLLGRLEEYPPP